ncbi:hypothetical protein GCM10009865_52770 [Aeromicrobium ponti]|uniref:Uncharacterized protein n=1 Tax=Cytobacillus oceanisediminis TaxID=665099 RepID=A0A562J5V1_9BACI|nr:hypothetical protein [Cytobacillus oceanisediminis]TWH78527.1 hypothetical protein IQ19_05291 [Cytobacillus oceanisediminis]
MEYKKRLLSVPLSAGLLLAGCGTDEQDPPPETEDVELEQNEMEENNTENEMQDPGTTDDTEMQEPGTEEEAPAGEGGMDDTGEESNMDMNEEDSEN